MHVLYFDVMISMRKNEEWDRLNVLRFNDAQIQEDKVMRLFVKTFVKTCNSSLFTLVFHLLDHGFEDWRAFEALSAIYASPAEHYNVTIEQAHKQSLRRNSTCLYKTVNRLDS